MAEEKDQTSTSSSLETMSQEPLLTHEKSLSNKVAKGSEAGDILDQQILWLGTQLVTQINVLIKNSRIHGRNNSAMDQPVNSILTLIKTLTQEKPVILRVQNDFLFLDETHLKVTAQQIAIFMGVIDHFNSWKIGAISIAPTVQSKDIRGLAHLFVTLDPNTHTLNDFRTQMVQEEIEGIVFEDPRAVEEETEMSGASQTKGLAKRCYGHAAGAVGDLTKNIKDGGTISFKHAKRAIQNIVDLMMYDESVLLGLTNLRCHDEYTHNHSVNVALLAVALGNRAGYPKLDLADLGLAALFHDMGKASIPIDVLNKPGEFSDEEWAAMRSHPTEGVVELTRLRGITSFPGRMASAAFEHHMNFDFSGYPKITVPWEQSLTGRILTIVDCYDAMTSSRVYRREPIPPEKVLKFMFGKSGQSFDPLLLKLFVTCVGLIPIGSLVLLDTNELAVVMNNPKDKEMVERPRVKLVTDHEGTPIDGPEVDLTLTDNSGNFKRTIIRLVDNTEYKFDTGRYFL